VDEMRGFKLMPEYECAPVWEDVPDGTRNVDPAQLPISPELARELNGWADEFEATFNAEYPPDSGFPSPEAEADFDRRGRDLCRRLAAELGDTGRVSYFSVKDNVLVPPDALANS
jgi:hypothetical protein